MVDIRRLDEATVERIAAGEVVERPASVVKELVENSLDADASRVEVAVEAGGREGIRVSDDGVGMTEDEVRRAVEEHTTSKIRDVDDLESGVATLGFRGEALHAIGAVSRVTLMTRPRSDRDVDSLRGTELTVEGGDVTGIDAVGCPEGTTIEVDDLFFNVPARRKYLKQDATEFAHVNTVVTSYALANPDVAVSLTHDGRETFATTGAGDRREAVMAVYGRDVADAMVDVDADAADLPDGPLDGVSGLASHPETTRASREYLSTYVNGRYVTASAVRDAVVAAYGGQLAPDRYPFAVLFLDLPAGDVDVNVHPRKLDVRFADEEGVRAQIQSAVESALLETGLLRSGAPRGKSAPDQAEISPDREPTDGDSSAPAADGESGVASDGEFAAASDRQPGGPAGATGDAVEDDAGADASDRGASAGASGDGSGAGDAAAADAGTAGSTGGSSERSTDSVTSSPSQPHSTGDGTDSPSTGDSRRGDAEDRQRAAVDAASRSDPHTARPTTDSAGADGSDGGDGSGDVAATDRKFTGGHGQARLGGDSPDGESFDSLPSMRILGQFDDTYVVAETGDGLVLIDQHAADERVNYERLRERFAGDVTTQALADPVEISLTAREAELFESYADALATVGFRAERTGDRSVTVRTVPSLVAAAADPELIRDALGSFVAGDDAAADTVEAAADELLGDLACYPSITGNTSLTEGSVRELLSTLDDCENPWACPHGRPVVIELDREEIDARFERDYPGHGGRRD